MLNLSMYVCTCVCQLVKSIDILSMRQNVLDDICGD